MQGRHRQRTSRETDARNGSRGQIVLPGRRRIVCVLQRPHERDDAGAPHVGTYLGVTAWPCARLWWESASGFSSCRQAGSWESSPSSEPSEAGNKERGRTHAVVHMAGFRPADHYPLLSGCQRNWWKSTERGIAQLVEHQLPKRQRNVEGSAFSCRALLFLSPRIPSTPSIPTTPDIHVDTWPLAGLQLCPAGHRPDAAAGESDPAAEPYRESAHRTMSSHPARLPLTKTPGSEITRILADLRGADRREALERLLPVVYGELRRLAGAQMRHERPDHTLQTTALVHETYLRMLGGENPPWNDRAHFFRAAAEAMRRILIEHARKHRRIKRGGDRAR